MEGEQFRWLAEQIAKIRAEQAVQTTFLMDLLNHCGVAPDVHLQTQHAEAAQLLQQDFLAGLREKYPAQLGATSEPVGP